MCTRRDGGEYAERNGDGAASAGLQELIRVVLEAAREKGGRLQGRMETVETVVLATVDAIGRLRGDPAASGY